MIYLVFSIVALLAGPLVFHYIQGHLKWEQTIDGFIFVTISGLVLLHIFPDAIEHGGWIALLFGVLGLVGPSFSEKIFNHSVHSAHKIALFLGVIGLFLHAGMDGASMSMGDIHDHAEHTGNLLALAVILHRIPVSLTLWWLIQPDFGRKTASSVLVLIGVGTVIGFYTAPNILHATTFAWFQAFVAGSLLHVVMHQTSTKHKSCCSHQSQERTGPSFFAGLGNLFGIALLVFLQRDHHILGDTAFSAMFRDTFLKMVLETAPALLLAYVLAGLASSFFSSNAVQWLSRGNVLTQSAKGMALGLPLPVCSCGIVPLYYSMIQRGAPVAAAMAFFIATPELGIDALLISIPLLGSKMTLFRLFAAAFVAVSVGVLVGARIPNERISHTDEDTADHKAMGAKIRDGLKHGLIDTVDHTSPWILLGLIVAALAAPMLGPDTFSVIPGFLEVPFFALIGLPLYVCASGATPIVAVLLWHHVSPGAALALLLTGPATNVSTFGVLSKLHGKKQAAFFGGVTMLLAMSCGLLVNAVFSDFTPILPPEISPGSYSLFSWVSLALLTCLVLFSLVKRGARSFLGELIPK
jgi:uncharacterized membrane protein YraQ (UPF0718 family)